ncbi:thioredoxin-like 1-2, chloroplastic [Prosopis cineraria]|uniref:thioredoxin-like 1-2, chloroplastic n=1 Tax=Prosopis cineraria TaxID=364024 RepID=UPI0024105BEF|nr:thioredoxin-like 1-2, chloroplastic [Prosopis cineraria]
MACSLKSVFCVFGLNENLRGSKTKADSGICASSVCFSTSGDANSGVFSALNNEIMGKPIIGKGSWDCSLKTHPNFSVQASACVSRALRWWEKTKAPNMIQIHSAQELVRSLLEAGDSLVVVDFYSPGCGGCKALHPKICQIAEMYPNAKFLQVDHEKLKPLCHSLHIHVLPFFRFYRGSEGRVCSFSCTIATIKKLKDALAKYGTEPCSFGPAKGLEETELGKLAAIGEIPADSPLLYSRTRKMENLVMESDDFSLVGSEGSNNRELEQAVMC